MKKKTEKFYVFKHGQYWNIYTSFNTQTKQSFSQNIKLVFPWFMFHYLHISNKRSYLLTSSKWNILCNLSILTLTVLTWLSRPRKMSIMKKRQAQSGDRGIIVTAFGYAMKARPGPASQKMTGVFLEQEQKFHFQFHHKISLDKRPSKPEVDTVHRCRLIILLILAWCTNKAVAMYLQQKCSSGAVADCHGWNLWL